MSKDNNSVHQSTNTSNSVKYKLLAVDDDHLNLGLFRLFLTQLGHDVTAVTNPLEAIKLSKDTTYDLIFTDIQMPEMDGFETARTLRTDGYLGPVIAITAHISNVEEERIKVSGINDVLIKPVTKSELTRVLSEHLESGGGQS